MRFGLLGSLVVTSAGREVAPTRPKQRALLAMLLMRAGQPATADELVDALWPDGPPSTAATALHGHVSALRKLLSSRRLRTEPAGYVLHLADGDELDIAELDRLLAAAADQEAPERAETLATALRLFRGPPMSEFRLDPFAESEALRLDELRALVRELRAEAMIQLGEHREAIPELESLVRDQPLRERAVELLMLALYRSGRQSDALGAAQAARRALAEELGVDPGPALQELERRVLVADATLTRQPAEASGEAERSLRPRGAVTFVSARDLTDATAPAVLAILARHGGERVQEPPLGATTFAFSRVRDATAAAAACLRRAAAVEETASAPRLGVHTTEVVADDPDYSAVGIRHAGHLAMAAPRGQALISRPSRDLLLESTDGGVGVDDLGELALLDMGPARRVFLLVAPGLRTGNAGARGREELVPRLPAQRDELVGREPEIREVIQLLQDHRCVTLYGPGGTGKTRLAVHVAAESIAAFPGGVRLADLAPLRVSDAVLPSVAAALGVYDVAQDDLAPAVGREIRQPTLLVLDNVEHVLPAATNVERLLGQAPALRILATSRAPLSLAGERVYEVKPLAAPAASDDPDVARRAESAELFVRRARNVSPDFALRPDNSRLVGEICRALDGLPLAIELAAARVSMVHLPELATRIAADQAILSTAAPHASDRQRTLERTIAWSHDLLDEAARRLFRRLAVFAGGSSLAAVESVHGEPGTIDTLSGLVDHSLVRNVGADSSPRFTLLETIHAFASGRLKQAGEDDEYRTRHLDHFIAVAEEAEPHLRGQPGGWLDRLSVDDANFRAALDHAAAAAGSEHEREIRLAGALWRYWYLAGQLGEGRRWLEQALERWPAADALRGRALIGAAVMAVNVGDVEAGQSRARAALDLHEALGDAWGAAYARFLIASAERQAGNETAGRQLSERAMTDFRALGDEHSALLAARNLAAAYKELGDPDRAQALYEDNLRRARATANARMEASSLGSLAELAGEAGRLEDARWLAGESLRIHRAVRDRLDTSIDLARTAGVLALVGRPAEAARLVACLAEVAPNLGLRGRVVGVIGEQAMTVAARQLDAASMADARREGRAMSLDDALTLALEALGSGSG